MKKRIALLLACIILVAGIAPAAAATAEQQADALKAAGLFLGTGSGYNLPGLLTRDQGITLALRAQGMEPAVKRQTQAEIDAVMANVADLADIAVWARPYVAFALKQTPAITTGVSMRADGKVVFAPAKSMTGLQLVTFLTRAMGYATTLTTAPDVAIAAKVLTAGQVVRYSSVAAMTREHAVDVLYSTVTGGVLSGTGEKLIDKLVSGGIVATSAAVGLGYAAPAPTPTPTPTPTPAPVATKLAVTDIQALGVKQLLVSFNREVARETVLATYYQIKDNGTVKYANPLLQPDKQSVILTVDAHLSLSNFSTVEVTVKKGVKAADNSVLDADYTKTGIAVRDTAPPALTGAELLGKRMLRLQFDKPVWDGVDHVIDPTNFTVKGNGLTYYISSATANYAERSILLTLGTDVQAGSLTVTVNPDSASGSTGYVRDFINFMVQKTERVISYQPMTTEPNVTMESLNRLTRVATVRFSRPVYGTNVRLYMMVKGIEAYGSNLVSKTESQASDVWDFTMPSVVPSGLVTFYLTNTESSSAQLSDLFGVKISDKALVYNNLADTQPPSVISVENAGTLGFTLSFNEPVDMASAQTKANYEVRNQSGSVLTITDASVLPDLQSVRITVAISDLQTYTIRVAGVKDLEGNAMPAWTTSKTIADTSNPKVTSAYAVPSTRSIHITFSEAMNTTDLATKSNYLVDADGGTNGFVSLSSGDTVIVVDNRHITLTLASPITTPSVKMAAMRDLSGKKLGSDNTLEYTGEAGNLTNIGQETVSLEKVEQVDRNRLLLTFNTRVASLNPADILFRQDVDGGAFSYPIQIQSILAIDVTAAGQSTFLVQVDRTLNSDTTWDDNTSREKIEVQVASGGTVGSSGTPISAMGHASALNVIDKLGGAIAVSASNVEQIFWNDFNGDGKLDTVVVKYDEAILEASLSTVAFTVAGYTVSGVSVDSDGIVTAGMAGDHSASGVYVILNITKAGQTADAGTKPATSQVYPIQDRSGNIID